MDSFHCNVLGGMSQGDGGDLWGGGAVSDALEERGVCEAAGRVGEESAEGLLIKTVFVETMCWVVAVR